MGFSNVPAVFVGFAGRYALVAAVVVACGVGLLFLLLLLL